MYIHRLINNTSLMIQRPGIREGSDMPNPHVVRQSIKNKRAGIGNYTIIRPGAKATSGVARTVGFNRLSVIDSENAGIVELGERTLKKLFEVKVPDPLDVTWLAEKARLLAKYQASGMSRADAERELLTNKPLGREQRTVTKQQNIGDSDLSTSNKIAELKEEVQQGRAESVADRNIIIQELARVFRSVQSLQAMSRTQFANLKQIARRAKIPSDRRELGLNVVYVDRRYYDENSGKINLLFIGKLLDAESKRGGVESKNYDMNRVVKDFTRGNTDGFPAVSVSTMYTAISRRFPRKPRYLDLDSGGMITRDQLAVVGGMYSDGFDNPVFAISDPPDPVTASTTSAPAP